MANTQVIHGGRAGREALTTGEEFTGPAKEAELAVKNELATDGRLALVLRGAIRLQAVADLYFAALIDAGERNDQVRLNSYVKTFTYIQSKALLAWQQVKAEQADAPNTLDYEQILAQRNGNEPEG